MDTNSEHLFLLCRGVTSVGCPTKAWGKLLRTRWRGLTIFIDSAASFTRTSSRRMSACFRINTSYIILLGMFSTVACSVVMMLEATQTWTGTCCLRVGLCHQSNQSVVLSVSGKVHRSFSMFYYSRERIKWSFAVIYRPISCEDFVWTSVQISMKLDRGRNLFVDIEEVLQVSLRSITTMSWMMKLQWWRHAMYFLQPAGVASARCWWHAHGVSRSISWGSRLSTCVRNRSVRKLWFLHVSEPPCMPFFKHETNGRSLCAFEPWKTATDTENDAHCLNERLQCRIVYDTDFRINLLT